MTRREIQKNTKSDELLAALRDYAHVLVVMHDNPDPDAIATAWAVSVLVEARQQRTPRVVAGGAIVRAENRQMVKLLRPPVDLVDELEIAAGTATVLVDCGLGTTNQLLTRSNVLPVAVIDHHQITNGDVHQLKFHDVRDGVAASATIAASYLREQLVEPSAQLATAILYAMGTETSGHEVEYSDLDRAVLSWLTERADLSVLAEIDNAPLSRAYFGDLSLAMQNTFVYEDAALCLLPSAEGVEIVGEVADLLVRCEGIRRVLCGAVVGSDLFVSSRTTNDAENATHLLLRTLKDLGSAGGHAHRAGGKIPHVGRNGNIPDALENELRSRWMNACGVTRQRGTRLVSKKQIVENL